MDQLQQNNKRLKEMVKQAIALQKAADEDNIILKEQIDKLQKMVNSSSNCSECSELKRKFQCSLFTNK